AAAGATALPPPRRARYNSAPTGPPAPGRLEALSMTRHATLPLIPTAVVGSHGKPGWWFASVKALEHGDFGPADLEEMFDDAANAAIRDMETAGIDIITDGEVRRLDGYVDSYYAIIKGIEPLPIRRKAGPWGYDQQTPYEAIGPIRTPPGGAGRVRELA